VRGRIGPGEEVLPRGEPRGRVEDAVAAEHGGGVEVVAAVEEQGDSIVVDHDLVGGP
jgi:hypothetical protein